MNFPDWNVFVVVIVFFLLFIMSSFLPSTFANKVTDEGRVWHARKPTPVLRRLELSVLTDGTLISREESGLESKFKQVANHSCQCCKTLIKNSEL